MDALDDNRDIKLYRASADLLPDITRRLDEFLMGKSDLRNPTDHQPWVADYQIRKLTGLLEPFQEWPQLLDPLLPELLRPLVDAFLKNLVVGRREHRSRSTAPGPGFSSISCGICCILNTLCKVRGVKVVTMFFNTEPKYLEPMLEALCLNQSHFVWQERYILLLWLSQLVLTPFDLQSISSPHNIPITRARVPEDLEPQRLPVIAIALLSAGLDNLSAAGKERESAGRLLVRIALRPDMQHLGLLGRLVKLMCKRLQEYTQEPTASMYECLGSLSILSGIVKSGSADDVAPFLASTFGFCLKAATAATAESVDFSVIRASAPARKMLVAILRTLTLHAISLNSRESAEGISDEKLYGMLEDTIRYLLDGLADRDNPVRLAASKALSMLVSKINENMKAEVVQAVLDSLEEDVLYDKPDSGDPIPITLLTRGDMQRMPRNVMAVNPLKWQGLLMTLGHLLFRRTASPDQLSPILRALLSGLDFEQRSAGGTSIGGSVRDAACFGFWSLARKYATSDLQSIEPLSVLPTLKATFPAKGESSLLQIVADRLVVTACLDPSGNIRRGSSAALQELIGRHPDMVIQGIALVQVVDYHAVARRSRAMLDVAKGAAELAGVYRWTLLNGLLGWRGVRAVDEHSRRTAASAISKLVSLGQPSDSFTVLRTAQNQLSRLPRENSKTITEVRHGLLLAISHILDSTDSAILASRNSTDSFSTATLLQELWEGVRMDGTTLGNFKGRFISELILEGAASLIASLARTESGGCSKSSEQAFEVLDLCLTRADHDIALFACADAAFGLFSRLSRQQRVELIGKWLDPNQRRHASFSCRGRILACGSVYATLPERAMANDTDREESSRSRIFAQLRDFIQSDWPIETQVVALRSLASTIPHLADESLEGPLCSALDNYTNDQRGDVGSLARFEAVQAVSTLLQKIMKQQTGKPTHHNIKPLIQRLFRLAGERLDKLRFAAWKCIEIFLGSVGLHSAQSISHVVDVSSNQYYITLLNFLQAPWLQACIIQGIIHSITSGTEEMMRVSRAALIHSTVNGTLKCGVVRIHETLVVLLEDSYTDDRQATPLLETIAFLMEQQIELGRMGGYKLPTRKLWNVVRKAHFKSTSIRKLEAAVRIYGALATQDDIRRNALRKLGDLLLHPYPTIRNAAADALYIEEPSELLVVQDWSLPPKDLKDVVIRLNKKFPEFVDPA